MNINIKTTHFELTDEIQDYLDKKLEAVGKMMPTNDTSARMQVELGKMSNHHKSGDIFKAGANLSLGGRQYRAQAEREDLYQAINEMRDSLVREVEKMKNKKQSVLRRGLQKAKDLIKRNKDVR